MAGKKDLFGSFPVSGESVDTFFESMG